MAITKSKKKSGIAGRLMASVTPVLVGAAVGVVDDAAGAENSEMVSYGALAVGIALPAFVPGTENMGNSLASVGSFMVSKNLGIAEKLGLTDTATTTGLGDRHALGNVSRMFQDKKEAQKKSSPVSGNGGSKANPLG